MLSFQGGIRALLHGKQERPCRHHSAMREWANKGVNVNAIAPGYYTAPTTEALRNDATRNQQISDCIPAGRWATPATSAARRLPRQRG
ncbi:MAG: hypothetical protein R3C16_11845 [Hyphomonadaceae bacterium]